MDNEKSRGVSSFAWLNATQFLGALNDNVFKFLLIFFLVEFLGHDSTTTVALASAIFVLPFLLFSHAAGILADRFSKRHIVVVSKAMELVIMTAALAAVLLQSPVLLYVLLFAMCTQSAVFGPSKYGIIPELVGEARLSKANSSLVCLTYLAIIIGAFLPPYFLRDLAPGHYAGLAGVCVAIAAAGLATSLRIAVTPAAGTRQRFTPWFVADTFRTLSSLRGDGYLFLAVVGSAYFLFLGAFIQQNTLLYGERIMGITVLESGYLFPMAALGIGLGALLAGRLSGRNIEFGVVPIGALGLTLCCVGMNMAPPTWPAVLALMFLIGLSSGLYIVPLSAFIQYRSPVDRRGEILACSNFMSFLGVAVSAGTIYLLNAVFAFTPGQCFVVVGVLTAVLAAITLWVLPDFLTRFLVLVLTRLFYRIRTHGADHVPTSGGALLVANHVTWMDALLIAATQQRRVRFLMARDIYRIRWIQPLFRLMRVIPVSASDPPRQVSQSLHEARQALDDGFLVCIFAEGAITRNGNMHGFRPGLERILRKSAHPIVPVYIHGAWGSIFSYYKGKLLAALPRRIPYPVRLYFGAPMPSTSTSGEVRLRVRCLSAQAVNDEKTRRRTLNHRFVARARRYWFRHAVGDTTGRSLTFGGTLTGAIALADRLRPIARGQRRIGLAMPTTVAGALVNVAVTLLGKTPVNLNYTASAESRASAMRQCGIRTVVTSRAFLERLDGFDAPEGAIYIEDLARSITPVRKVAALLKALVLPVALLRERDCPIGPDAVATIVFSSGSTAEPKGVMLSHHNLISNIEAVRTVFKFEPQDRMCAVLPFFHSFGFTVTLWGPLVCGFSAHYHPNPLDGAAIGAMCRAHALTTLVSTPTFLLAYLRRAGAGDFATLRAVVTGAEKLAARVADAFEQRFGVRPYEGYGATELSPVAAISLPDVTIAGVRQVGVKQGSVGHPVPGVAMRVRDPDGGAVLPDGAQGVLEVHGPNVMLGYLDNPEKTADVLRDGWYDTGDIAEIDGDGFVFLHDRLSRYSKIGGEMVPHIAIEEALLGALNTAEAVVAVTAAPDEKKGEQLVVLFTPDAGPADRLYELMRRCDLPNLWKPKRDNYAPIDAIPMLGSGKRDLKAFKALARAHVELRPELGRVAAEPAGDRGA